MKDQDFNRTGAHRLNQVYHDRRKLEIQMDSKLENLLKKENPLDFIKKKYVNNFKSPLKPLNIGFAPEEGLPKHKCNFKYMA